MRHDKKVKDKRILLKGGEFLAVVEYFRDTPARDEDLPIKQACESIPEAQKFLAKYPRDMWVGYSFTERNYREIDERRSSGPRKNARNPVEPLQDSLPRDRPVSIIGRTFARPDRRDSGDGDG